MQFSDSASIFPATSEQYHAPAVALKSIRFWAIILGTGIFAGLLSWAAGEACLTAFKPPRRPYNSKGIILQVVDRRGVAAADAKNAGLAFSILGGLLGATLGASGSLLGRTGRGASSALFGLAIGASAGIVASAVLLPAYNTFKARNPDMASTDMLYPLLVHAGIWMSIGAAGGLAFTHGLGIKGLSASAAMGGIVGAAFAALAYELIGVAFFPDAQTSRFVSITWQTRLFARLAVSSLAALGMAAAVVDQRSRPVPPVA